MRRRCGWLGLAGAGGPAMVWAKGDVVSGECPKPAITADSLAWIELYAAWEKLDSCVLEGLCAKDADALAVIQRERERSRNEQQ